MTETNKPLYQQMNSLSPEERKAFLVDMRLNEIQDEKELLEFLLFQSELSDDEINKAHEKYRKTKLNRFVKDKYLFADITNLTKHVVSIVIKRCIAANTEASFLILLSVFTGRAIDSIRNKNIEVFSSDKSRIIFFRFDFELISYDLDPKFDKLIETTEKQLQFQLPPLLRTFKKRDKSIKSDEEITELINKIKKDYNVKFTLIQLSQYMNYWMVNNHIDTTEIAIINGRSTEIRAGVNYYQVKIEKLQSSYYKYIDHLISSIGKTYEYPKINQNGFAGSNLVLKKKVVGEMLNHITEHIKNIKPSSQEKIEEQYNLFTVYCLLILNLSTGHRPVNDIYNTIESFDLNLRTLHICDKSRNDVLAERVTVLTQVATKQMHFYLNYLKYLSHKFQYLISGLKKNIDERLTSKKPIFMFLKKGKFIKVTPSSLNHEMSFILPIADTWHRHFIRSNLYKYNVSGQQIDMWMGHNGLGGYGLSYYSNLSMHDLEVVANAIDRMFFDLKVTPLNVL